MEARASAALAVPVLAAEEDTLDVLVEPPGAVLATVVVVVSAADWLEVVARAAAARQCAHPGEDREAAEDSTEPHRSPSLLEGIGGDDRCVCFRRTVS